MKTLHFSTEGKYSESVAYSYIRWSSAVQGDGDSLRRQKHMAEDWCHRNGVRLADEVMIDAGVSAYRGKNLKRGCNQRLCGRCQGWQGGKGFIPTGGSP
ncbi:recombinase family protein [Mesorhizobium sp. LMG 17147]|uniref:recombinase family protein n=1 Tax=Mesorhizobium sp. LMG 17147 TaxID=2963091 RepID=UPI0020CA0FA7|nr:recombinase family protein [Mesorhizobium sp. LMG 17147]MCP9234260.1 recombinase family protein [Mesorhizobium sp. LMG 17147]